MLRFSALRPHNMLFYFEIEFFDFIITIINDIGVFGVNHQYFGVFGIFFNLKMENFFYTWFLITLRSKINISLHIRVHTNPIPDECFTN